MRFREPEVVDLGQVSDERFVEGGEGVLRPCGYGGVGFDVSEAAEDHGGCECCAAGIRPEEVVGEIPCM